VDRLALPAWTRDECESTREREREGQKKGRRENALSNLERSHLVRLLALALAAKTTTDDDSFRSVK
jgi:hypothetical protein